MGYCDGSCAQLDVSLSVNEMTDAILRAEGIDPLGYCDQKAILRSIVAECYEDMGINTT